MPNVANLWLREILLLLTRRQTVTRAEIFEATGLNPASVSHALRLLIRRGLVMKVGALDSKGGRKQEILKLNADAGYLIAVDLEGTSIRFALTNLIGDIRFRWEEDLQSDHKLDPRRVVSGIERVFSNLEPDQRSRVLCVGVSHPGFNGPGDRITAVNLGWEDVALGDLIRRAVKLPLFFEAAQRTCVEGERWMGVARNSMNCVYVIVGQGVGAGCFVDGHLLQGAAGTVGEIGHIAVDPKATDLCNCGKRGCLEAVASLPNLLRQYREKLSAEHHDAREVSATAFFDAARRNVPAAVAVVDRAARHLGIALAHLVQILNPELIVFGGYLIAQQDVFLPRIRATLSESLLPKLAERLDLKVSSLGLDIGLKGAASMAFRRCIDDPELLVTRVCPPPSTRAAPSDPKPRPRPKK